MTFKIVKTIFVQLKKQIILIKLLEMVINSFYIVVVVVVYIKQYLILPCNANDVPGFKSLVELEKKMEEKH